MRLNNVFVYGTCLWEQVRHHAIQEISFIGRGKVRGLLYDVGQYPALLHSENPADYVTGEIYGADDLINYLLELDEMEGYYPESRMNSLFLREQVQVVMGGSHTEEAFAYLYNGPVTDCKIIPSGDYARHLRESSTAWIFFMANTLSPHKMESEYDMDIIQHQIGYLNGHRMTFHGETSDGNLLTGITESSNDNITGMLFRVYYQHIEDLLDPIQVGKRGLTRQVLKLQTGQGSFVYAECFLPSDSIGETFPARKHIQLLLETAQDLGFHDSYLQYLRSI